jgi:hypothetical protein
VFLATSGEAEKKAAFAGRSQPRPDALADLYRRRPVAFEISAARHTLRSNRSRGRLVAPGGFEPPTRVNARQQHTDIAIGIEREETVPYDLQLKFHPDKATLQHARTNRSGLAGRDHPEVLRVRFH